MVHRGIHRLGSRFEITVLWSIDSTILLFLAYDVGTIKSVLPNLAPNWARKYAGLKRRTANLAVKFWTPGLLVFADTKVELIVKQGVVCGRESLGTPLR